jgi:protein subunit release factor A
LEKQERECLAALEELEKEKARLETELSKPEVYSSREKAKTVKTELDGITALLETKTAQWEEIALELSKAGIA